MHVCRELNIMPTSLIYTRVSGAWGGGSHIDQCATLMNPKGGPRGAGGRSMKREGKVSHMHGFTAKR